MDLLARTGIGRDFGFIGHGRAVGAALEDPIARKRFKT
jgi:hypothetical protein